MFDQNIGRFAPPIASLLLTRGTGLAPLQWQKQPHRAAKKTLDESDDAKLFGPISLVSEPKAAGVRALLYLWNGWIGDCRMYGQAAGPKEQLYLTGLCERQLGNSDAAKKAFQQLDGHTLYAALGTDAIGLLATKPQPATKRFREILELNGGWEPYAFVDLYQQASNGILDTTGEECVREIQCREFEWLFCHCYEGATGQAVPVRTACAVARRPRKSVLKRTHTTGRSASSSGPVGDARPTKTDKATAPPAPPVRVVCPRCGHIATFPGSMVGKAVRCQKCMAFFEIPRTPTPAARR